ncbi:hypothetical protein POM88_021835 [Heracleum sosnowskyi]|uniref:Uncharacterized protein n=1 Tax=Heracleum sosnowskyi TaxID=360622 RepID=A0AAD8IHN3_9APIA|nr:hypothetical protein POM88_021835 [Heracleum sosnowskyi]
MLSHLLKQDAQSREYTNIRVDKNRSAFFTLGAVFPYGSLVKDTTPDMYMIITNKTKDRIILYTPTCYGIPEGDECMTWLSHWRFGNHEVGSGDEINVSIFIYNYIPSIEVKEVGIDLVYEELEQACVHSAKRQKIQQARDKTFQYIILVDLQPDIHHGTTQLYLLGCSPIRPDCLVENMYWRRLVGLRVFKVNLTNSESQQLYYLLRSSLPFRYRRS